MTPFVADARIDYDGTQLRSRWIAEMFGVEGDAVAAFRGACDVSGERLVDLEDFALGNAVAARDMLHFIVEIQGADIRAIGYAQRLLCATAADAIDSIRGGHCVQRRGDDLYVGEGKLSVSVATVSPVSGLIHLGINITTDGVPVRAASLTELGMDHRWLAREVASRFSQEIDSCAAASRKVRPVR